MSTQQSSNQRSLAIQSLSSLLHQCFQTKNFKATKTLHSFLLRTGLFFFSLNLHTNLFLAYTTCSTTSLSLTNLFNSIPKNSPLHWNAIIAAFSHNNLPFFALETVSLMHKIGLLLDSYTLCSSLTAASSAQTPNSGKLIHTHVVKSGWSSSVYVGTAVVDFYVKSMVIEDAQKMFDEIPVKNTVCVNALLTGYANAKHSVEGLQLLHEMQMLNLNADQYTLCAALRLCTELSAVELGRQIHAYQIRKMASTGCSSDAFIQSILIEMYGKSGLINKARNVFDQGSREGKRDLVLWTSMISAYGKNGMFQEVIEAYNEMLIEGERPDAVAFVAVLSACRHTGQVGRGLELFESMNRDFGLLPQVEHYSCVVDMLCRCGELEKALEIVGEIASVSAWGALLSACKEIGNVELGRVAAKRALELDSGNVGIYVVLSNLYARAGMWGEIEELRALMKDRGLKKDIGCSWIESTG